MNSTTAPPVSTKATREEPVADVERLCEDVVPVDRGGDVLHAVGDVRLRPQRACDGAVRLEPEPLDVEGIRSRAGHPDPCRLDPALARLALVGDEANVVERGAVELLHGCPLQFDKKAF